MESSKIVEALVKVTLRISENQGHISSSVVRRNFFWRCRSKVGLRPLVFCYSISSLVYQIASYKKRELHSMKQVQTTCLATQLSVPSLHSSILYISSQWHCSTTVAL